MSSEKKPVIAITIYSTYGHIATLAKSVIKGVEASGATVKLFTFAETLSDEIRTKMHAAPLPEYPVMKPDDLKDVDAWIIGAPTRYGRVPAQVSAFFDSCGQLYAGRVLQGKMVTMFTSTGGLHGGNEETELTTMPFFVHQGMVYVPIGYSHKGVGSNDEVHGLGPWGVSTIANGRQPSELELDAAEWQGKYFTDYVTTFVKGKSA